MPAPSRNYLFLASAILLAGAVAALPTHAATQAQWRLAPEPRFAVGGADSPADELFTRIAGAHRFADGRFVVADEGELRLAVYDAAGRRLHSFGRDGAGPGEFRHISAIFDGGNGTVGVWDVRLVRVTRFRPDGTVVSVDAVSYPDGDPPAGVGTLDMYLGSFTDGTLGFAWLALTRDGQMARDRMTVGVFDARMRLLRTLGTWDGMIRIAVPGVGSGPIAFSPFPWTAVVRDSLAYTNGSRGEIVMLDPRATQSNPRSFAVAGVDHSLRDTWNAIDNAADAAETPSPMMRLAQRTDRSVGEVPRFSRMMSDDRGRIWLKDFDPGTDALALRRSPFVAGGTWRIVDSAGRLIARITMPANVAPLAVHGDLLMGIARDALDVESFVVYDLVR